ncbi:hypothetical protein KPH14_006225 [Odynerus spinipes]|uniref:Venom protein n=1 Tax=Odynerus spinipes TaxID=1348599 RepID=A0AAD9VNQ9_9HYME|nr:hypothetical protein KPH14_006225 [Odynerus spinipes]
MKIVPFLCVVVLCVNQVIGMKLEEVKENLKRLEEEIKVSKGKVDNAIRDINKYRNNLQFNFNSKITARQLQDVTTIRCMTDLLLEEIRVFVADAKAQGKKPEKCYENSQVETTIASTNGYNSLDKCTKEAKGYIDGAQTSIDNVLATGQALLVELDRIYPDCYSRLPRIMLKCVTRKMEKTNVTLKAFESSAASVETNGETAFNQGYLYGIACYRDVVAKTRESVRNIRASSEYCIGKS